MADDATPSPASAPSAGPDLDEARSWIGSRLDEIGGTGVAKVEGVFVDSETGRPEWLAIRVGRFGQRGLVPARDAVGVAGRVWVPYSRDTIKGAPRVGTKAPLSRESELELLRHFGLAGEIGRTAELNARGFEAVTASPAT
jgi:PRC-barrel domain